MKTLERVRPSGIRVIERELAPVWESIADYGGAPKPSGLVGPEGRPVHQMVRASGSDFVFNISKGEVKNYCKLAAANDALIMLILSVTSLETDATLKDYDDLAALLAGTSDEVTNTGYARKTITAATITVDDTNDRVDIDIADQTWSAVAAGTNWAKLLICYDPDTTGGTDSSIVPLTAHSFDITPDGSDITAVVGVNGFFRAS